MENLVYKMVEEKLKLEKAKIEEEWKLTETLIREEWRRFAEVRMEEILRMTRLGVEEKLKQAETRIFTEIMMSNPRNSAEKSMKLQFMNKISQPILTGEELKGEGNTCIEVSLISNSTGKIVEVGPESSASVEIVVLEKEFEAYDRDDWTMEEFNGKIVHEGKGKMPLLEGNTHVKLQRGRGVLEKVKFRHWVSKIKPRPEFRLGARIGDLFDGIFVKEGKTESFIVKDFRNKYYKKHEIPSLSDKVWRLHNIRKGGKIEQRLQGEEIYTVEEFLIRLLRDPEGLKNVVSLGLKKWEAIVKHARTCPSGNRMYCYINSHQKTGIVFDILGQVLELYSEGRYNTAINMLSENKAEADQLLISAISHWEDIISFDDGISVNQYFTSIKTSVDDSDNPPISPYNGHHNSGETLNNSNSSVQGIIFNSTEETGLNDLDNIPFSVDDIPFSVDDGDILHGSPSKLSPYSVPYFETIFPDFDSEFTSDNYGMQQHEDIFDKANDGSGILFVEQVVIPVRKPPKRWRKLFLCVKISLRKRNGSFIRRY